MQRLLDEKRLSQSLAVDRALSLIATHTEYAGLKFSKGWLSQFLNGKFDCSLRKARLLAHIVQVRLVVLAEEAELETYDRFTPEETDPEALLQLGVAYTKSSDLPLALRYFERAWELSPDPRFQLRAQLSVAFTLMQLEYYHRAEYELKGILRHPKRTQELMGRAFNALAWLYRAGADHEFAKISAKEAVECFEHTQDQQRLGLALNALGNIESDLCELEESPQENLLDEAIAHYQQARDLLGQAQDKDAAAVASVNLGLAYALRGNVSEAREAVQQGLKHLSGSKHLYHASQAYRDAGKIEYLADNKKAAREYFSKGRELAEGKFREITFCCLYYLAELDPTARSHYEEQLAKLRKDVTSDFAELRKFDQEH